MKKYKAVIADVDGTLMAPSEYPSEKPADKMVKKVKEVTDKGIIFSIATGRSLEWVGEIISGFQLTSLIILDNGARIYDTARKKFVWQSLLKKEIAQKVFEILSKEKDIRIFFVDNGNRLDNPDKVKDWKISKILVLGVTPEKAEDLYKKLSKVPSVCVTKSISGLDEKSQSVHVTDLGGSKEMAVKEFSKITGVGKEEIIGIGDSFNDVSFLQACGLKVAVANAVPEIKKMADYIAPPYWENGVARVLDKFILSHAWHDTKGEQKEQTLILTDKNGKRTGIASREKCHKGRGLPHLAFMAFITDDKGNFILTKRSNNKSLWANFWDAAVVSHVLPNETPKEAALRRGREELGVEVEFREIGSFYYFARHGGSAENEFCHVLMGKTEDKVMVNPMEIGEIRKIELDKLKKELTDNPGIYTPWLFLAVKKIRLENFL